MQWNTRDVVKWWNSPRSMILWDSERKRKKEGLKGKKKQQPKGWEEREVVVIFEERSSQKKGHVIAPPHTHIHTHTQAYFPIALFDSGPPKWLWNLITIPRGSVWKWVFMFLCHQERANEKASEGDARSARHDSWGIIQWSWPYTCNQSPPSPRMRSDAITTYDIKACVVVKSRGLNNPSD